MAVYDINRILVPDAPPEYEDHTRDVHYVPAPCQVACPIGTDAPSYIAYIWDEDYEGAFEAITSTNPFSSICGRVCDAPCEPACRRVDSDGAVQIRNLKRFVMDKLGATYRPPAAPVTRSRSIGIVGAGPAGLVAAHDLCVAGYAVHVYEMTDRLGGMMIWGIPAFRLPPGIIDEDVDRLMQRCPGLEVHLDTALGRDVSLAELKNRKNNRAICVDGGSSGVVVWSGKCGRCQVRGRCERGRFAVERAMMRACQTGGGPGAGGEARRGRGAPVGAVRTGSVMGGATRWPHRAAGRGWRDERGSSR